MKIDQPVRRLAVLSVLLALAGGCPLARAIDRSAPTPIVTARALQADAAVLRRALETLHPALDRDGSAEEMRTHFAELERSLDHDQTVLDAFLAFTRFTATLRCGHSGPNFSNQPRAIADLLKAGRDRLPFQFLWIDGRMVVTRNLSNDPRLVRGTVVETIDGVPTARILATLLPLVRADGHNDAKRVDALQVQGFGRIETFDVDRSLVYPMRGESFALETSIGPLSLRGVTDEQRVATLRTASTGTGNPLGWTLRFPDDRTALLTMPTWVAFNTTWDWKGYLRDTFETVAREGSKHLVIDLRGNEGGSDVGREIAAWLVAADTAEAPTVRTTRYRRVPDDLRPVLDTWDPSFLDWGAAAVGPDDRGDYRLVRETDRDTGADDDAIIRARSPHFGGRVDVLVDAANSSATFGFARLVQSRHLGRLIGQPTGGNLQGINGGAFFFVRLPASHIEIDLPLIAQRPDTAMPDRGLLPDVIASPTLQDIVDGTDPALRAAMNGP